MPQDILQSQAFRVPLKAFLSSDHVSAATGKTVAVVISKNGAAFANPSAGATSATEIASGWYYVDLSTTDTATLGPVLVRGTASGVDDVETILNVVKATNRGMSGIPDAAAAATGGLPTVDSANGVKVSVGTGAGQLNAASGVVDANVVKVGGTAASAAGTVPADLQTIKTQTVTCAAGVTVGAFVGNATAALGVDASGRVDVGKVLGTASAGAPGYVGIDWAHVNAPTSTVALSGTTVGTVTTYTGNTPQTGDNYARLGAPVGASISADIQTRGTSVLTTSSVFASGAFANLPAATLATAQPNYAPAKAGDAMTLTSAYDAAKSAAPTASVNAAAVWDLTTTGHATSGTFGAAMGAAGTAGDPWSTALPGAYASGTAGYLVGHNAPQTGDAYARLGAPVGASISADIQTRSIYAGGTVAGVTNPVTVGTNNDKTGYALSAAGLDQIAVETGVNARQALSPILAAAAGVLSGAGTGTVVIKGGNVAVTRVTATTDTSGNRTAVTLALPT